MIQKRTIGIVGEQGDTEMPLWRTARIAGLPLVNHTILNRPWQQAKMERLFTQVRDAAYTIIARKGYTNTAIGMAIVRLAEAVLDDQRSVLPVSRMLNGEYGLNEVCLRIPSVIGINGVEGAVMPKLDVAELEALRHSAETLQAGIGQLRV